ncbi:MAG: AMP-binding protein [Bacteroidota bacterium]
MPYINIKNNTFYYDKLPEQEIGKLNNYDYSTLIFCKKWLTGSNFFNLNTSGSTGRPKKINLKRVQLSNSAKLTIEFLRLNSSDHFLICLNTQMVAGMMMLVRAMKAKAAATIVSPQSNPFETLKQNTTCNFTALVPLQLEAILSSKEEKDRVILNKMKAVLIGGGPLHKDLQKQIETLVCPVYHTYGMTETVSHIALKKLNGKNKSNYYQTLPGIEIKTNKNDCLMIKAAVTEDQWLTTNDRVSIERQHSFKWLGRIDFVINSGGIKVQAEALEEKISMIFKEIGVLNRFFITGLPDKILGEMVCLVIESKVMDNETIEKLKIKLKATVQKYEIPRKFFFVENFTITNSGKINRPAVIKTLLG